MCVRAAATGWSTRPASATRRSRIRRTACRVWCCRAAPRTTATDRAAASVAAALPTSLLVDAQSIQALSAQSITVVLDHGRVVQWGSATRNADKARVLPVLLRRKDTQIDVTDPDQPFTR